MQSANEVWKKKCLSSVLLYCQLLLLYPSRVSSRRPKQPETKVVSTLFFFPLRSKKTLVARRRKEGVRSDQGGGKKKDRKKQ